MGKAEVGSMIGTTSFGAGRAVSVKEPSGKGKAVVYWMQGAFRASHNEEEADHRQVEDPQGRRDQE